MTSFGELFKDDYNYETLVVPPALAIAPTLGAAALLGFNISILTGAIVAGVEIAVLPLWLMANVVRDAGRKKARSVFSEGKPTTVHARLRNGNNGYQVKADRQRLSTISGIRLLTHEEEQKDPIDADARIEDAVNIAKESMRSEKYKILKRELKSYGFWRNMLALKPFAVTLCLLITLLTAAICVLTAPSWTICAVVGLQLFSILIWDFFVTEERLTDAAERYSDQFYKSLMIK